MKAPIGILPENSVLKNVPNNICEKTISVGSVIQKRYIDEK
jgi:hypothetical protein